MQALALVVYTWQGPSLLKNFGGDKPYCFRFSDVTMFTQPWYDLYLKLAQRWHITQLI